MIAWFLSDLHLKEMNERNSERLLCFLLSLQSGERPATHLFLVGDIFDLWVGNSKVFERKFEPLVHALAGLRKQGIDIQYFEGNHDVHVQKFWSQYQIPVHVDHRIYQLGPYKVRVEHGDLINPEDKTYLQYRKILRSSFIKTLAHTLPGAFIDWIGSTGSRESRKHSAKRRRDGESQLRQMIRTYAEVIANETEFDLIITGHMHIRDEYTFERAGKNATSINLGSWFDEPQVLKLTSAGFAWETVE